MAGSRLHPDSRQTIRRSSTSGSPFWMTRPRRLIWCDSHNPGIPKPAIMLSNAIGSTPVTSSVTTPTAMAETIWEAANITGAAVERYPAHTSRWRISPIRVSLRGRIRQIRSARALGSSVRPTGACHATVCCDRASSRSRLRSGACRRRMADAIVPASRPTATNTATKLMTRSSGGISVIHRENLSDGDRPDHLERDSDLHQTKAHRIADEGAELARVERVQRDPEHHGERRENPSGYPALRGQHAKLTTDAEAVPGHAGKIVEHFGQVAAGLPLCQHGDGKEPDVHQRDTGGERPQHLRERQTIVVLFVERPEFRRHRIGHLVSHHGQRARERMSRAEGASHQADGV